MTKTVAILALDREGDYEEIVKLCERINANILIISNNFASEILRWAAKKQLGSLAILFSRYVKVSRDKHKKQMCLVTHAKTEKTILRFLSENEADYLLVSSKSIRLTHDFLEKFGRKRVVGFNEVDNRLGDIIRC